MQISVKDDKISMLVDRKSGYELYTSEGLEEPKRIYFYGTDDCEVLEKLDETNIGAFVPSQTPRILKLYHLKNGKEMCSFSYPRPIMDVKLNRCRVVVCLKGSLYIHNIKDMKLLHTIVKIPNFTLWLELSICALSICKKNYVAYPGPSEIGKVQIFDTNNMRSKIIINAHNQRAVTALAFSPDGTKIATSPLTLTVIRVFSVMDGFELFEFRRDRLINYRTVSFSSCGFYLSGTSAKMVDVFKLESNSSGISIDDMTTLQMTDVLKEIKLPNENCKLADGTNCFKFSHSIITTINDQLSMLVVPRKDSKQVLLVYNLSSESDLTPQGPVELTLCKQLRLEESLEREYKNAPQIVQRNCIPLEVIRGVRRLTLVAHLFMFMLVYLTLVSCRLDWFFTLSFIIIVLRYVVNCC